ncbi:MAG TPA: hypothetical protein DDW84_07240 [Phycisphaerales bacterium]|nr:MAG: hypothetical protein A2Y13_12270 [Planctomycetes bacterium GWC2_45_44]HBG78619.1 hypothetical protein [Phycisphaerales bacterium]HBR20683.1 hypothetical protein [Phycisphaerales bacterium]
MGTESRESFEFNCYFWVSESALPVCFRIIVDTKFRLEMRCKTCARLENKGLMAKAQVFFSQTRK